MWIVLPCPDILTTIMKEMASVIRCPSFGIWVFLDASNMVLVLLITAEFVLVLTGCTGACAVGSGDDQDIYWDVSGDGVVVRMVMVLVIIYS